MMVAVVITTSHGRNQSCPSGTHIFRMSMIVVGLLTRAAVRSLTRPCTADQTT